jgi:5-methylcytosine-specific restriction endonuclease McrA
MDLRRGGNTCKGEKNNGNMKCEGCGQEVEDAAQHTKGVKPPGNEAHVDHVDPKSNGGSGTPDNGQVLCRDCNLNKGSTPPQTPKP